MKFIFALAGLIALVAAAPQAPNPTPTPPAPFLAIPTCGSNVLNPVIEASGCQFTGMAHILGFHIDVQALIANKIDPACFCALPAVQAVPAQILTACGSGTTNEQSCITFLNDECSGQSGWPINPSK